MCSLRGVEQEQRRRKSAAHLLECPEIGGKIQSAVPTFPRLGPVGSSVQKFEIEVPVSILYRIISICLTVVSGDFLW